MPTTRRADPQSNNSGFGLVLAERLSGRGVQVVFGRRSYETEHLFVGLDGFCIRHQTPPPGQAAGGEAGHYARRCGRPGVVITGLDGVLGVEMRVAEVALIDAVPLLYISPGPPASMLPADFGWMHEGKDRVGAMGNAVQWSVRAESPGHVLDLIDRAFDGWQFGALLPAHIEIPAPVVGGPNYDLT